MKELTNNLYYEIVNKDIRIFKKIKVEDTILTPFRQIVSISFYELQDNELTMDILVNEACFKKSEAIEIFNILKTL